MAVLQGTGHAGSAAAQTANMQLGVWASFRRSVSENVDALITGLLQDGDAHVQADKPSWALDQDEVLPQRIEFRARNMLVVPHIRRSWAILCLIGMVVWLLVDIYHHDANGLVPGLRDSYLIDSKPFDPDEARQPEQQPGITAVCTCSYSASSMSYTGPPYSMLVAKAITTNHGADQSPGQTDWLTNNAKQTTWEAAKVEVVAATLFDFLDYCASLPSMPFPADGTPAYEFLTGVLDEMFYLLSSIRLEAPTSAVMLPVEGWKAARMAEAQRSFNLAASMARYKVEMATSILPNDHDVQTALWYVAVLQASFSRALGKLLDMPDDSTTVEIVDQWTNNTMPITCDHVPSKAALPFALLEWCVPSYRDATAAGAESDNKQGCYDAYTAYVRWCAPPLCHTLGPKPRYLQAMQIMSAIGGMWSIISMFAFAFLWKLMLTVERQIDLDGKCLALHEKVLDVGRKVRQAMRRTAQAQQGLQAVQQQGAHQAGDDNVV